MRLCSWSLLDSAGFVPWVSILYGVYTGYMRIPDCGDDIEGSGCGLKFGSERDFGTSVQMAVSLN